MEVRVGTIRMMVEEAVDGLEAVESHLVQAGGGSGYVLTDSSYKPSGYLLGSEYYLSNAQTIAGNQSFPTPGGGTEKGHSGNGYARITVVE